MALDRSELTRLVQTFSLVKDCDTIENGMLRIATPFQYPDGSFIDLFLEQDLSQEWKLTDMGQTVAYLLDLHVKPWSSARREQVVADICASLGVRRDGAQLFVRVPENGSLELTSAMVRLAQACLRLADLAMTQRFRMVSAFKDEVEEFIVFNDLRYDTPYVLEGRFGKPVEVDFRVQGRASTSLLLTLSTANSVAAHGLCNEVFRRCYDLQLHRAENLLITTYDTTTDVFREEDLCRIREVSTLFGFPAEAEALQDVIAA